MGGEILSERALCLSKATLYHTEPNVAADAYGVGNLEFDECVSSPPSMGHRPDRCYCNKMM